MEIDKQANKSGYIEFIIERAKNEKNESNI